MYNQRTKGGLNPRGNQPQSNLLISTVRSFDGGLNVADTDLNMQPTFAKVLDNIERGSDGTLSVRSGTKLFKRLVDTSKVINMFYFNGYIISVQASGVVYKTDGAGTSTQMKIGTLSPWPAGVTYVSFTIFSGDLLIANGRDKPLFIEGDFNKPTYMHLDWLQDEATLTNVNTPVGKYIIAHAQYTCIAGVSSTPSTLYISARNTSGTWPGDPIPNDAIALDLGPRVSLGGSTITGMVAYRDKLLVTFERGVLPINLGVYSGSPAIHTPTDDGFVEEFGCLCHRSLVSVGDDTFYVDNVGVNSIARVTLYNTLRPLRVSQLIGPLLTSLIQPLSPAQIDQYIFSVYDLRNFRYITFVPVFDGSGNIIETIGFSYTNIPSMKIQAWARLRGWKWQCACRTSLENIMFAQDNKIYFYNFDEPVYNNDFYGDTDINGGNGVDVTFVWEMPWTDFKHRMDIKYMRYIALDTQGTSKFTVEAYVDNFKKDDGSLLPELSMDFVGGSLGGYGNVPYGDSPYGGGGASTRDERLYTYNIKFKILKLLFFGVTKYRLKFISVSVAYLHGGIRR